MTLQKSVALSVKEYVPVAVGLPEISAGGPLEKLKPGGSVPVSLMTTL